jgi:hypothetical protein
MYSSLQVSPVMLYVLPTSRYLILYYNNIWQRGQIMELLVMPSATSSLLSIAPNIPLSILLSNTLNLYSYLSVRDQIEHPYKTT